MVPLLLRKQASRAQRGVFCFIFVTKISSKKKGLTSFLSSLACSHANFGKTREICLKRQIFFFLFRKEMSDNSYAKLTKEIQ